MSQNLHKGKNEYSGAEIANMRIGQGGWIYTTNPGGHNDVFVAGAGTDADPVWYYPDVRYWSGVKCYSTTDAADGDCLLTVVLTPYDTDAVDQSKADTPGSDITLKLQSGQSVFGAFSKVEVTSAVECTAMIFKG